MWTASIVMILLSCVSPSAKAVKPLLRPNVPVPPAVVAQIERELVNRDLKLRYWLLADWIKRDPEFDHLTTPQLLGIHRKSGTYREESREAALAKPRPPKLESNILATAAVVDKQWMTETPTGWTVTAPSLIELENVCPCEPFAALPAPARCTAFLVDTGVLATAHHCLDEDPDLGSTYFVFGFHERKDGIVESNFAPDEVLTGAPCIGANGTYQGDAGEDWVLICLNGNPPSNRTPVTWRSSGKILDEQSVYVVGHPAGLPIIYAPDAWVVDNQPDNYFIANLDTYGGNSGSPVFNAKTDELEGMLIRGDLDFVPAGHATSRESVPPISATARASTSLRVTLMDLPTQ